MTGSPRVQASAMVPGPALVTITSAADIHSCTFETKPSTRTSNPSGQLRALRFLLAFSFLPQMTTSCEAVPPRVAARRRPVATATCCSRPTPSPPPMTSTVRASGRRPRASRTSRRVLGSAVQKSRRSGSPYMWIADSRTPQRRARSRRPSEGTKTRSASGWNHIGCAPPRSVTTVTKGMRRRDRRASRRNTLIVMCCVQG
mmetsp:Transcript_11411/g.36448  ORF Transcript_11411/g.36448 Transcript_11411/m.36448 type:complete len:201 (-) Transcript_11411:752-1354(-)